MRKLADSETLELLRKYRIPAARQFLSKNERQACQAAKRIGYPVALKVSSPDIIHKTDAGCVLIGVDSEQELLKGFRRIMKKAGRISKRVDGIVVQEMARPGSTELIIGSKTDPQFGPVLMFGLGGIFTEILKDVSFRLIPLDRKDVKEMMGEIRGRKVLEGARGRKRVNMKKLEDLILAVSRMVQKERKIRELDLNPVFADDRGVMVVDARILA
jgi:acyl-CoA synthetase (NDP forming)